MARFELFGLDELIDDLEHKGYDFSEYDFSEAINAGVKKAIEYMQEEAPKRSGTLRDSIAEDPYKRSPFSAMIYPRGYYTDRKRSSKRNPRRGTKGKRSRYRRPSEWPVRTMTVACILEYGTSTRKPNAFMRRSVDRGELAVQDTMANKLLEQLGKK